MANLKIKNAPLIPDDQLENSIKLPTGGKGNYAVSLGQIANYTKNSLSLAIQSSIDELRNTKADKANTYTKEEVDDRISLGQGGVYGFKTYNDFLSASNTIPPNSIVTILEEGQYQGDNIWDGITLTPSPYDPVEQSKEYTDSKLVDKANISDVYTKIEADSLLDDKLNVGDAYNNQEIDNLLSDKVDQTEFVNKTDSITEDISYIYKHGAALPYDSSIEYAENSLVVKDGELQQFVDGVWSPLKKTVDASDVKDESGETQQQINDATTRRVGCIHDLISPSNRKNGETVRVESYWLGLDKGGNTFVWRSGVEKSRHNGVTIIDPTKAWNGSRETWAYQSGIAARTEVLFPVGAAYTSTIDGTVYPYRALNNPTNIRDRMPVIGGWASPIGNNSGTGCWVAEDTLRVSVCQAGAVGDASYDEDTDTATDGTDDSIAFFVAANALQKHNSTFVFEPFIYTHGSGDERIIFLLLEGFKRLKIEAHGARIQSHSTNPSLVANSFMWIRSKHVDIYGMEFDGLLNMRTPYGGDANQINKQNGFLVLEGSRYVNFWGVTSNRALMDGFTIGSIASADFATPYEINLHACTSLKNYRQGMSLVRGKGVHVYGGDYSETGTLKGTAPMAGIDFECEAVAIGEMVTDSFVIGARLQNNVGAGFTFALGSKNCFIDTCTITGNGANGVLVSPPTIGNEVRNCIIENNTQLMMSYGDAAEIYAYGYRTKFLRNAIKPRRRAIVSTAVGNTKHIVFDGNIIDATDSAAGAGEVSITGDVCSQYVNNIHINTETELPNSHAVRIDSKTAVVTNNEHYQDRAQRNSGGFLGILKAKLVTDNKAEGSYVSNKPVIEFRRNATDFVDHFGRNIINGVMGDSGAIKNGIYTPPVINGGNKVGFGTAAPTTGTWKAGDIVYKSNPSLTNAVHNMAYFECTTAGTFEDLTGITGSVTTGTRLLTLSSVAGLYVGMFISVEGAVANNEIVAIDTVASTVTISANATATVSGAAVTTTDPVFVAKGRVAMRGTTANRPTLTSSDVGFKYYDTTLAATGKPIEWTGLAWVDATGATV